MEKDIKQEIITTKRKGYNSFSATKTILAILWHLRQGNVAQFLAHPYARIFSRSRNRNTYQTTLTRLKKEGMVVKKGRGIFRLSSVGEKAAMFAYIDGEAKTFQRKAEKWDGVWRIIFFDIPEKKRHYRDFLRVVLKAIGFKEFQQSVWIYPHQVPSFLKDLLFEENIKRYTRFISAERIDFDQDLRRIFNLNNLK